MADTTNIPLGQSKWNRMVGQEPDIQIKNRYFETNPANQVDQVSFLSRPGLRPWQIVGDGPIRTVYSQQGTFNNDLFVVSDYSLYRVSQDTGNQTFISNALLPGTGKVQMVATGTVNGSPEFLFLADGRNLYVYLDSGYATGTLSGTVVNGDTIWIGTTYYKFTNGSVNAGTPAGTLASPWLVALGGSNTEALSNLYNAINATGITGVTYSTALTAHPTVLATFSSDTALIVRAQANGGGGNGISTNRSSLGANWGSTTLTGGGSPSFTVVPTPNDVGVSDLCYTSEFVVVIPAQGEGINGRFFWIEPAATTIDPLNFATAERAPDPIVQAISIGDQFWLFGTSSTEIWYFTGDSTAPVQRVQGRLFDRGTFPGTAVPIKDEVLVVSNDGYVYSVTGGPTVISTPAISEQIRKAIRLYDSRVIS